MTAPPLPPPYGELRVKLPRFLITALRQLVHDANAEPDAQLPRWTVSSLLESWLLQVITKEELRQVAKNASPEFKREAEAWIRWSLRPLREPRRR